MCVKGARFPKPNFNWGRCVRVPPGLFKSQQSAVYSQLKVETPPLMLADSDEVAGATDSFANMIRSYLRIVYDFQEHTGHPS
jgi:hypothetical protein